MVSHFHKIGGDWKIRSYQIITVKMANSILTVNMIISIFCNFNYLITPLTWSDAEFHCGSENVGGNFVAPSLELWAPYRKNSLQHEPVLVHVGLISQHEPVWVNVGGLALNSALRGIIIP